MGAKSFTIFLRNMIEIQIHKIMLSIDILSTKKETVIILLV